MSHWSYIHVLRTCPNINSLLKPLEDVLRTNLFRPSLLRMPLAEDLLRELFSLPCRLSCLGITNPCSLSSEQYANSLAVTSPLVDLLINQSNTMPIDVLTAQSDAKRKIHNDRVAALECAPPPYAPLFLLPFRGCLTSQMRKDPPRIPYA